MMSSPEPFINAGRHVDEVAAGEFDLSRPGSTREERAINLSTALGARERIYHHPDDDAFVPKVLPDPVDETLSADDIYNDFDEAWLTDGRSPSSVATATVVGNRSIQLKWNVR